MKIKHSDLFDGKVTLREYIISCATQKLRNEISKIRVKESVKIIFPDGAEFVFDTILEGYDDA